MTKGYRITNLKMHLKGNEFTLSVYDMSAKKSYKLYFRHTFNSAEYLDYIKENDTLFIYDVERIQKKRARPIFMYKESNIPEELNNVEFYEKLCKKNGRFLIYVPDGFKTEKMCYDAVSNDPIAIRYVPERFYSEELFIISLRGNGICLQFIPKDMRSLDLCELALTTNPLTLRYIPDNILTIDMCKRAVTADMKAINYVPLQFLLEVYQECIIGLNRLLPLNKKDYHYRDYQKIIKLIAKLSASTITSPTEVDCTTSIDDIDTYQLQLDTAEKMLKEQLAIIEAKKKTLRK